MSSFRKMVCPPSVLHREIRPPIPRSKPTICAVTRGNIAELAATTFVALIIALLSVRTIEYTGEQRGGGESVSQSSLRYKLFFVSARVNQRTYLPVIGPPLLRVRFLCTCCLHYPAAAGS